MNKSKLIILLILFSFAINNNIFAQAFKRLATGESAPDITLKDLNGTDISTSKFKNKNVVAIIFFKNPSLRGEKALAYLQDLYLQFQISNGFEVVAVYCPQTDDNVSNKEVDDIKEIVNKKSLSYPVLLDNGLAVFSKIGVITLPSIAILDKDGVVQYILPGFPEFGAERDIRINLKKILGIPEEIIVKKDEYKPKNKADFSYKLALVVNERGNTSKAIHHIKTAISKDPDYALAHFTLANLYAKEGKKDLALEAYRKALTLEPNNINFLLNYGFLCMDMNKKDDALLQFKNIIAMDKTKAAEGYYGMGTIYMQNNIFDSAKIKVEEAIKLYSEWKKFDLTSKIHFAMSYYNLAEIYLNLKDTKSAIDNYKTSFELYKDLTEKLIDEKKNRAN